MNICYFILLQTHYYLITTCYFPVTTPSFCNYCFIITLLLNFYLHYFKLLKDHYYIITVYYCWFTTQYFHIITSLLFCYYGRPFHHYLIITALLPHHDCYRITTILLQWSVSLLHGSVLVSLIHNYYYYYHYY
jgi:hypothetical protein